MRHASKSSQMVYNLYSFHRQLHDPSVLISSSVFQCSHSPSVKVFLFSSCNYPHARNTCTHTRTHAHKLARTYTTHASMQTNTHNSRKHAHMHIHTQMNKQQPTNTTFVYRHPVIKEMLSAGDLINICQFLNKKTKVFTNAFPLIDTFQVACKQLP